MSKDLLRTFKDLMHSVRPEATTCDDWKRDYKTIEQALKRNEPMKVEEILSKNYLGYENFLCPACEVYVSIHPMETYEFCPNCGQALDWSKE